MSTELPRLLLVEDEDYLIEAISLLWRKTFAVDVVRDPQQVQEYLQQQRFHIGLVDMYLDGFTGRDVLKWRNQHQSTLPVVIYSGTPFTKQEELEIFSSGAAAILAKPFDFEAVRLQLLGLIRPR